MAKKKKKPAVCSKPVHNGVKRLDVQNMVFKSKEDYLDFMTTDPKNNIVIDPATNPEHEKIFEGKYRSYYPDPNNHAEDEDEEEEEYA